MSLNPPFLRIRRRSKSQQGSALTELAIVLPLILLPLLAVVTDYVLTFSDYQVMLRAARAGAKAAFERAKSAGMEPDVDNAAILFDSAENAIKDYLNGCNHLIPGDCDPAVHNENAYRIELRGQGFPSSVAMGIRVSLSRIEKRNFFGGALAPMCAVAVFSFGHMSRVDGYPQIDCDKERIIVPPGREDSPPNPCGIREWYPGDRCPPTGVAAPPNGCGDDLGCGQ